MSIKQSIKIVIPGDDPPQMQGSPHLERLEAIGEVALYMDRPQSLDDQIARAKDAQVIINSRGVVKWPGEALRRLPALRMIATCSIGTDMIDLKTTREMGIVVSNQPGRTAPVVAEHAVGLMFAVAKLAAYQTAAMKAGLWLRKDAIFLQGKTLGAIGTGNVGREVIRLCRSLGMKVVAWTFNPTPERAAALGVEFVSLEDLLRNSDVVSLHLRLTDASRGIIGAKELAIMKKGAILVNCARGQLVDTGALISALNSGHLGGAALDVYDVEPLPQGHPLLACEQVVLTPHMADMTPEGVELLNEGAVDNVIAFLDGHPRNVVS